MLHSTSVQFLSRLNLICVDPSLSSELSPHLKNCTFASIYQVVCKEAWKLPQRKEKRTTSFFDGFLFGPYDFLGSDSKTRCIPKKNVDLALGEVDRKYWLLRPPIVWKYFDPNQLHHICYNFWFIYSFVHSLISWGLYYTTRMLIQLTEIPFSSLYPLQAEESYRHVIASLLSHQDIPQKYSHKGHCGRLLLVRAISKTTLNHFKEKGCKPPGWWLLRGNPSLQDLTETETCQNNDSGHSVKIRKAWAVCVCVQFPLPPYKWKAVWEKLEQLVRGQLWFIHGRIHWISCELTFFGGKCPTAWKGMYGLQHINHISSSQHDCSSIVQGLSSSSSSWTSLSGEEIT